jgi:3'-5' exoribonuclease
MEQHIKSLTDGFSIVLAIKYAVAKNNSTYATVTVRNSVGQFNIYLWNTPKPSSLKVGALIQFITVQDKEGFLSTPYASIRTSPCPENSPLRQYLNKVVSEEEWTKLCLDLTAMAELNAKDSLFLKDQFSKLYQIYKDKVAARSNHHNFPGGLLQHTYELLNIFYHVKLALPYKVNDLLVILGCLYHDFGKVVEYDQDSDLTSEFFLEGHPCIGARTLSDVLRAAGYPDEFIQHARHCVLAHHGYKEYGAPVVPCTPEAFTVANCDLVSGWGVEYNNPSGTPINVFGTSTQVQHYVDTNSK